jgi:hypothetical protein
LNYGICGIGGDTAWKYDLAFRADHAILHPERAEGPKKTKEELMHKNLLLAAALLLTVAVPVFAEEGFKEGGKEVGQGFKKIGKSTGKVANKSGKAIGKGFKKAGKETGHAFKQMGKDIGKAAKEEK